MGQDRPVSIVALAWESFVRSSEFSAATWHMHTLCSGRGRDARPGTLGLGRSAWASKMQSPLQSVCLELG